MDEATLHRALAQAMTEVTEEIHALTDELDGLSSRLGLVAGALTGTAAAARRMAQLSKDDEASVSQRLRWERTKSKHAEDCGAPGVALQDDVEDPGDDRCLQCGLLLPDGVAWLCPLCETYLRSLDKLGVATIGMSTPGQGIEGASAANGAPPRAQSPLAVFEILP